MMENSITRKFKLTSNEQVSIETSDSAYAMVDPMFF